MAPELRNINTFMKYSGIDEQVSYNEWLASGTQPAFELAYHETTTDGAMFATPQNSKEFSRRIFLKE